MKTRQKNKVKKTKEEKSRYEKLMDEHPLLFARSSLSMTRTCMCWGIECNEGWYTPLRDLCDLLETLNLTIAKQFGLVIRAEQVKEKYGTLRFYYNIEWTVPLWRKIVAAPFDAIAWIFDTDFKPEKIDEGRKEGNTFKNYRTIWHPRWRHWMYNFFGTISARIKYCGDADKKTATGMGALQYMVDTLIENAEHECYCTCEECGHQIGTDWSPRCETEGWITYICDECAAKRNVNYSFTDPKTGKLKYFNGKTDITEEIEKRDAEIEKARREKKAKKEE